jgi:hypothetical protein
MLRRRIRQRFGRKPVMMTLVEEAVERPLVRHGFCVEGAQCPQETGFLAKTRFLG